MAGEDMTVQLNFLPIMRQKLPMKLFLAVSLYLSEAGEVYRSSPILKKYLA